MGAIFGVFGESEPREVERLGGRLAHRGRIQRIWSPARNVWLGTRRHDTDDADAPPEIAFGGVIENRDDVARLCGVPVTSERGPSRLILDLTRRHGLQGLWQLSGPFALARWDQGERQLVLARDPWSIAPLYLARVGGRVLFASEYKALLAFDDVPTAFDREALQHLLRTRYLPRDATGLAAIRPVPGGTWLTLGGRGPQGGDYRDLPIEIAPRTGAEHAQRLREAVIEATRRQTRGHARIGVALSTGLDSAVTLAAARQMTPRRELHTFTARFGPDDQDMAIAADLAQRYDAVHHEVPLDPADLPALLPQMIHGMEDPVGGEEFVCFAAVAREAARHVPLLLAGHQSDVLFGGMPRHRLLDLASRLPLASAPLMELMGYTQLGLPPRTLLGRALVRGCAQGGEMPPPDVLGISPATAPLGLDLTEPEPLNRYMRSRLLGRGDGFAAIERVHAAFGLHMTSPFYDLDLVRCAFQIPGGLKIRRGRQKQILRDAARGLLPDHFLNRGKKLLRLRQDRPLARVLDALAGEYLDDRRIRERGLIDPAYVAELRRHFADGGCDPPRLRRLWSLLTLEIWCQLFHDRRGEPWAAAGPAARIVRPRAA